MTPSAKSLADFFKLRSSTGYRKGGRERNFGGLTPDEAYYIIKLVSDHKNAVDDLVKFVKGHAKIARELTLEDVQDAYNDLTISEVMNK